MTINPATGRKSDGSLLFAGDVFRTASGRETTPFPKQKAERFVSLWLIENAVAEAVARGSSYHAEMFARITPVGGKKSRSNPGFLNELEDLTTYLFDTSFPHKVDPISKFLNP